MRPDVTGRSGQVFSWAVKKDRLAEMQKLIGELAISADRDIGVELVESDFEVELPPAARKAYDEMAAKYLIELDGEDILSANAAVMRAKLLQICNGHVMDNDRKLHRIHDAKLDAVVEAATSSPTPVLVAYPYQADERALAVRLGRSMRLAKEPGAIEQFRQGKLHVLGFHPETMSHGVDGLQGVSNTILWFGAPDRFDWYHQVFKRLHRDGQQASAVFVRRFIAKNTIERRILDEVLPAKGGRNAALLQTIRKEHT
jgi:hypothetical protein